VDDLLLRRTVVFASALVYWGGVWVQIRRVRKRIGRSPNVKPRGAKERLLWAGWLVVVVGWMGQPVLAGGALRWMGGEPISALCRPVGLILGLVLVGTGYLGTLWCYALMGDTWRMGVKRTETTRLVTRGLYGWVRHPIYLLQIVMLAGSAALLPSLLSLGLLLVHFVCVWTKAADEEAHLREVHGEVYRAYQDGTGRLFPRFRGASPNGRA